MQKELGFSHQDIFGGEEHVMVEKEVDRDGLIGPLIDKLVGRKTVMRSEVRQKSAMRVQRLTAYIKLLNDYYERKEREHKKHKKRQQFKQSQTMQ